MTEAIGFFYDPLCPWAWRTSKWVRELEEDGAVTVDWRLFSLGVVNQGSDDVLDDREDAGAAGLRTLAYVKSAHGNESSGRLYAQMGRLSHEMPRRLTSRLVRTAVKEAGWDAGLIDAAFEDDETKQAVLRDHRAAVEGVGAFGVPTIVLSSGRGIFGPVIGDEETGDAAELWSHVRWLIERGGFYELKRERS